MNHFRSRWGRVAPFLAAIFTLALLLCVLLSPNAFFSVQAAEKSFLQVQSSDFTVCHSDSKPVQGHYKIVLEYSGDENLPHNAATFNNYALEVDGVEFCLYEETGLSIHLSYISHYDSPKQMLFVLKTTASGEKVGYTDEITSLTIKKGSKLGAQDATNYLGIEFIDGITLLKTNEGWSVQETRVEEERYEVDLNATNVGLSWNQESALLEATIALPFTRGADVCYDSTLNVRLNNISETVTAIQYAGEAQIRLLFKNYVAPLENELPCISIKEGKLIDSESGGEIIVSGDISFYEYVDGTWSTEKIVQLKETVLGITTERKLGVGDTYVFALPQTQTDKLYLGWVFQDELVQAGKTVEIASYTKRTIETEAVCVGYGLINGASIRYDQTGDSSGIRFGAKLLTEDFAAFEEYIQGIGIIVMPSDLLGSSEFILANYGGAGQAKNFFVPSEEIVSEGDYFTLYATIVKMLKSNYNRSLCARAYVLTESGEYLWGSTIEKRSVYQVATTIMEIHKEEENLETWKATIVETYLNGVANVAYENGTTKLVSSALSPVITAAETVESGNLVTLTLTTQKTLFAAITYNGKRVKNATQSYADGILTITFDKTQWNT